MFFINLADVLLKGAPPMTRLGLVVVLPVAEEKCKGVIGVRLGVIVGRQVREAELAQFQITIRFLHIIVIIQIMDLCKQVRHFLAERFGIFAFIIVIAPVNSAVASVVVGEVVGSMNAARFGAYIGAVIGIAVTMASQPVALMKNFIL